MRLRGLLAAFFLCLSISAIALTQDSVKAIDFDSIVSIDGSTASVPVGYSFDNFGPYTAFEKIWIFYSNGNDAVWRTRSVEDGASWSEANTIFSASNSPQFNMAFDGRFFHFIRAVDGDLMYIRGEAKPDGSIDFTDEVVAYSDPVWKLRTTNGIVPRHFSITIDNEYNVWVGTKVGDGNQSDSNFKPIALSSVANNGTWQDRQGFPKDLAPSFNIRGNGRAINVIEISDGKILYTWSNDRASTGHPEQGLRARLWSEGEFGSIEVTQLPMTPAATSIVVPEDGIAILNAETRVSRRSSNGEWVRIDPEGMNNTTWNVLTAKNETIRIWDFSGSDVRYKESNDNGESWGSLITKWTAPTNIFHINGSHAHGSQGQHHSLIWAVGSSPYDIYIGIEGFIPYPQAPQLVSPPNGAEDLGKDVTFEWEPGEQAFEYQVQIATDSDFSDVVIDDTVLETFKDVEDLDLNIHYFWRVRSITEGGTESEWSDIWEFKTVGISPRPLLVTPEDGAGNQPTSITFEWEESPGAETYQLQVATVSDFTATFFDNDAITDTEQFVDGFDNDRLYYWRVRAINEFGEGDWSDVWSFNTQIGVPMIPVLVSPEDDTEDVLTSLTFEWEEADLADTYRIQVAKVSDFASTVVNTGNLTNTTFEKENLEHSTTYYWRVNATNETGTSGWSSVWSFTTIIETPEVPVLVSPADSLEDVSTRPVLEWDETARAETYRVQIAIDTQFTDLVVDQAEIDSLQLTVIDELDEFTTHYWRVNATNIGGTSDWSEVWQFTTDQAFPVAPALVSPADGGTDITDATLLWNSVPTATEYRVQISKEPDFSGSIAVDRDDITNTFFTATNLEKWTTYYWRVRGISHVGQGYWSETWSFETGDIVSVEQIDNTIPDEFVLRQNYPNPFNPVTMIQFAIPEGATVRLEIYNMLGQRVATLIDGEHHPAGHYEAIWDARDVSGNEVSSGMYMYRISAGDYVNVKKMLLMK